ncbi:MAG: hypothetical protein M9934_02350 [Thermomicrobiales bacterium]|nr:hypothetical protein [Thermomicrobiales bacterium]MCO5227112.1 hypothetical protein [Thermomicrobiales bacterium]
MKKSPGDTAFLCQGILPVPIAPECIPTRSWHSATTKNAPIDTFFGDHLNADDLADHIVQAYGDQLEPVNIPERLR